MSAYKIQRIGTETFLSNKALKNLYAYLSPHPNHSGYNIDNACVKNGRVFTSKAWVLKYYNKLGAWKELFTIRELN